MSNNRIENASRNIAVGIISNIILMLMPFVNRTVIIYTLGAEYTGLGSLFSSVLCVLSITELGFNAAIVYSMYSPIAKKDYSAVQKLVALYRHVYKIVGIIITVLGISLLPFLRYLINGDIPANINLYILYILFLIDTVLGYYLFAYKESVIIASQRQDISYLIRTGCRVGQYTLQFIFLLLARNYYVYVILGIVGTLITNLLLAVVSDTMFPEYKIKNIERAHLTKDMKRQMTALLINRICSVTRNSLDSIIISSYFGLVVVAIYNNYYYIMNAVYTILLSIGHSITAVVGNSLVLETSEKNHKDLINLSFMNTWITGLAVICMVCLYQPFMQIWVGEALMLSDYNMILFGVYFYVLCMCTIRNQYITASGTQEHYKTGYILQLIGNIVLNIVLGKLWGITGIILATIITTFFIDFLYMTSVLFKTYFKDFSGLAFILKNMKWLLEVIVVASVTLFITSMVHVGNWLGLIIRLIISIIIPNVFFWLLWRKTNEYQYGKSAISKVLIKFTRK